MPAQKNRTVPAKTMASPAMGRFVFSRKTIKWVAFSTALTIGLLVWLVGLLHPLPPGTITMATGPDGSAYAVFAKRYKILLAKQGITLNLVQTKGGVENLAQLMDPHSKVQVGFVEGGIATETDSNELLSLGTIGYEPMWFFTTREGKGHVLKQLKGKRVSVGPEGSDSRALVTELMKRNGLDFGSHFQALGLEPEQTEAALLKGDIDAAILVNSYASPVVRSLVKANGILLADFKRADAYVAIFPSLTKLMIPEGVADLERDKPPRDTTLLATKTSLIIRGDLHPALQYLLLEAASQIHSRHGIFQKAGEFPAAESLEIPLSPNARHYYKSGRPFLQRYMPFWLAALVEQLVVLLIPVLGLLYPLARGLASLYGWGMQRKIFLIYGELHWLESQIDSLGRKPPSKDILERLEHLRDRASRVKVSSNYMPMLYSLKENIAYVHSRLKKKSAN